MSPPSASRLLRDAKVPAFLVTNPVNIRYMTGCEVSVGAVLVSSNSIKLFVDARYAEKAASQAFSGVHIVPLQKFSEMIGDVRRIGFEGDFVTCAIFGKWKKKYKNTKFVQKDWLIEEMRRQKSPDEIRDIKKACVITKKILSQMPRILKEMSRKTERDVAFELDALSRKLGADGMAFDPIVAFGEHTSRPHHAPTDRRLKKGDLVQIDMGVKVNGYCSDYSRVYFTGAPTTEQRKAYRALQRAKKTAEKMLKIGVTNHALDSAARDVLSEYGYHEEFSHSLGHGLGLEIHEGINLSKRAPKKKLLRGEVITIEPGLYFAGKWGMRLEDTHVI